MKLVIINNKILFCEIFYPSRDCYCSFLGDKMHSIAHPETFGLWIYQNDLTIRSGIMYQTGRRVNLQGCSYDQKYVSLTHDFHSLQNIRDRLTKPHDVRSELISLFTQLSHV